MSYDRNNRTNTNRRYAGANGYRANNNGGGHSDNGRQNENYISRQQQQPRVNNYQQQRQSSYQPYQQNYGNGQQQHQQQQQQQQRRLPPGSDMPLRMVVNAKYVGAIIGQGGANIRQISKDSKARCVVDVSRGIRDTTGIVEKVINIYGPVDNCSKACVKILELISRESENDPTNQGNHVEPELKLRAHNNLVGRLIGKGGGTIKKIMEETGCTVFVSNNDVTASVSPNSGYSSARSDDRFFVGNRAPPIQGRVPLLDSRMQPGNFRVPLLSSADVKGVDIGPLPLPPPLPFMQNLNGGFYSRGNFFHPSINELNAFNMERTITVRGPSFANIGQAEQRISAKLRQCWENDMLNPQPSVFAGGMMNPLMNTAMPHYSAVDQYAGGRAPYGQRSPGASLVSQNAYAPPLQYAISSPGGAAGGPPLSPGSGLAATATGPGILPHNVLPGVRTPRGVVAGPPEIVHIYVPHNMVGALIGTKGAQIRNICRLTGAHIRIESADSTNKSTKSDQADNVTDNGTPESDSSPVAPASLPRQQRSNSETVDRRKSSPDGGADRRVTVTGNEIQQYKAQFWIFQRVAEQGYRFIDDVRLCTELLVPSRLVGRIIGKGGQNVRELQRTTGAQVKVPENGVNVETEETLVHVIGNFNAAHAVQSRVRQLLGQLAVQNYRTSMAGGDHPQNE